MNDFPMPVQNPANVAPELPSRGGSSAGGSQRGFDRALNDASQAAPEKRDGASESGSGSQDASRGANNAAQGDDKGQASGEQGSSKDGSGQKDGTDKAAAGSSKEAAAGKGKDAHSQEGKAKDEDKSKKAGKDGGSAADLAALLAQAQASHAEKAKGSAKQEGESALLTRAGSGAGKGLEDQFRQLVGQLLGSQQDGDDSSGKAAMEGQGKAANKQENGNGKSAQAGDGKHKAAFKLGGDEDQEGKKGQGADPDKGANQRAKEANESRLLRGLADATGNGKNAAARGQGTDSQTKKPAAHHHNAPDAQMRADAPGMGQQQAPGAARGHAPGAPRQGQASQPMNQAVVHVAKEAADGKRDVQIKLNPPNLGNMRVQLQVHDNKVQAIFHMDHRGAAHLLDGNMHHLRAALHGQNLELEDVQVQVGSDGSQGQFDQGENGDHGPGQGGPDGGVAGRGGEASEAGEDARGRLVAVQTPGSLSLMA